MNSKVKKITKVALFFAIGALLLWVAYRGQDISSLAEALKSTRWIWIVAIALFYLLGHYSRAARWRLLLEPLGYKPRRCNLFMSVLVMYLSNLAVPRSGEVLRCGLLSKYEKIPFAKCLGTVVTERIADLVALILIAAIVITLQWGLISGLVTDNPDAMQRLESLRDSLWFVIHTLLIITTLGIIIIRTAIKQNILGLGEKINSLWKNFRDGMLTIIHLRQRTLFIIHTLFINFVYFYAIYLGFKAFGFTEHLTLNVALTVFITGTFGVVVPSPGGMGTWHFAVIETLALFGIKRDPDGRAFALVIHGLQDVSFLILGGISLILMPIINKDYVPIHDTPPTQELNT